MARFSLDLRELEAANTLGTFGVVPDTQWLSTQAVMQELSTDNFIPVTIMPIRITSYSASLIDHIYYFESPKNKEYVSVKTGNFSEDISDHLPNYLLLLNNK